jgi:hypothetical protein
MPGSVQSAAPTTVMPWSLCRSFGHARVYGVSENPYPNGESQRGLLTSTSRKSWRTARRLAPTVLATFWAFFKERRNEPFYFYDPWDANFAYDPTGASATGRYVVRFASPWQQVNGIARIDIDLAIIEIA